MTDVMTRVDAPADLRMVPYTYLKMFGRQPDVVTSAQGGLRLLADPSAALAVPVPWGAIVAASTRDDGVLEIRSRNRPAEGVTLQPDQWPESIRVPGWARPAVRAAFRLRAAGLGTGGATLVVHTGLPFDLAIPVGSAVAAATTRAFTELYGIPGPAAVTAAGSSVFVEDRAADLAALSTCPGEAIVARADTTVHRLPWNPAAAGLRLLVVEPGDPVTWPGPRGGDVDRAVRALRGGDLPRLGRLLTAAGAPPAFTAAVAAANNAGALGAGPVGDPSRAAMG
ncbi:MAG TPA: hypothetical protein VN408_42750, partial [Actinoplanes sp.]|nr:hypothetical protein [Actinoplanes sp.]